MSTIAEFVKGVPDDQLRVVIAFLAMLPLGWIFTLIKNSGLRLAYGFILGVILQFYVYGFSFIHVFIAACVNFAMLKVIHPSKVGKYALVYNLGHNSAIHLYRLIYEYDNWSVEISTIFMMTMCKFAAFAYSYQDAYNYSQNKEDIKEYQKEYMIKDFTLCEYFSYACFFSTSVCGPFMEFTDFINFIHLRKEYSKLKSTVLPSVKRLFTGFLFYCLFNMLKQYASPELIIDENNEYSFTQKLLFLLLGFINGWKYIGAFCLCESSVIASGVSFAGDKEQSAPSPTSTQVINEHDEWGKVKSVHVVNLLLVYKASNFFRFWNISVHTFLKRYVYIRLLPPNATFAQKEYASSVVFFTSALWHGFHPTYFVAFAHFYLCILLEKQISKVIREFSENNILVKNKQLSIFLLRCVFTFLIVSYLFLIFISLDHIKLIKFLKSVYALGTVLLIILNVLLFWYNGKKRIKKN